MNNFIQLPSSERADNICFVIIHCSAFAPRKAVEIFKQSDVSAHYIIASNGRIIKLVDEEKCAWHAGKSKWQNFSSLNKYSIGIELCSHSLGQNRYNAEQIKALIKLLTELKNKYNISAENILGHSDVAPTRKPDPGKAFPWKKLAKSGFGLWYESKNAAKVKIENPEILLSEIGYDTDDMSAVLCAFCRHFYPSKIKKISDMQTLLNSPAGQNIELDKRLINRIKAVAYAYGLRIL